jgi:hypothetical protein
MIKSWKDGAKVFSEFDGVRDEVAGPTIADLHDVVTRLERKVDILARRMGAYTTLEGVTREEKDCLKGGE